MKRICLATAAATLIATVAPAAAEWLTARDETVFGERAVMVYAFPKGGVSMFSECDQGQISFGINTMEKNTLSSDVDIQLKVSIDSGAAKDYAATLGKNQGEMYRATSKEKADGETVAKQLVAAKKTVEIGIVAPNGSLIYGTKFDVRSTGKHVIKVLEACGGDQAKAEKQ